MPRLAALVLVFAVLLPVSARAADETVVADDWFAVYIGTTKAGHGHTKLVRVDDETVPGGTRWVTFTENELHLSRNGAEVVMSVRARTEEDVGGKVVAYTHTQKVSADEVVTEAQVIGDTVHLKVGRMVDQVPYPPGSLGPAAIDRRLVAAGLEPGTVVRALAFQVDTPASAAAMSFAIGETEPRTLLGRRLRLHRCDVENSASASSTSVMWLDGTGRMRESGSDVPGIGPMRMVKTSEELARSVTTAVDVFAESLIEPNRGIGSPRRTTTSQFRLSRRDGAALDAEIPVGEGQKITRGDDGSVTVDVVEWTPPEDFRALTLPVKDEAYDVFLKPSPYLETGDKDVRAHAAKAVGDTQDALEAARRIERYVRRYVTDKSLDVGFATAAEVVRDAAGDCTEHAVLSAALARVVGLPSRIVVGLVFVPGMSAEGIGPRGAFSYHMWTEALVATDTWFPLDAALGGFDATHVALAKSELSTSRPVATLSGPFIEVIRSLRIEVVAVR